MKQRKYWFVFSIETYYPAGGMTDFVASFRTEKLAKEFVSKERADITGRYYMSDLVIEDIRKYL